MKRALFVTAVAGMLLSNLSLPVIKAAEPHTYTVSVLATTNVADYKIYSDDFPTGHAGPGEFRYGRAGDWVHYFGKLDLKASAPGVQMIVQLSLPFPATISNYAYAVGNVTNPGGYPAGTLFGSQIGVEGNNTSMVIRVIAGPENPPQFRAYAVTGDYIADPLQ